MDVSRCLRAESRGPAHAADARKTGLSRRVRQKMADFSRSGTFLAVDSRVQRPLGHGAVGAVHSSGRASRSGNQSTTTAVRMQQSKVLRFLLNAILLSFISSLFSHRRPFSLRKFRAFRHKGRSQLTLLLLAVTSAFSTLISYNLFLLFPQIFLIKCWVVKYSQLGVSNCARGDEYTQFESLKKPLNFIQVFSINAHHRRPAAFAPV